MNSKTILAVALAAVSVTAFAQETKPVGLSVRLGAFFPTDSGVKNATSKTWFVGGVDYKLHNSLSMGTMGAGKNGGGDLGVSVDYFQKGSFRSVPILATYTGGQNEFFWTVGLGLALNKYDDGTGTGNTVNKSSFGYALAAGYNFQQGKSPLFVEARYYGNSKTQLSGFGLEVGFHF